MRAPVLDRGIFAASMSAIKLSWWRRGIRPLLGGLLALYGAPTFADAQQTLAYAGALEARGEHAAAAQKYTDVITDISLPGPTRRQAYLGRGVSFGNQANFSAAINDFTAAIQLDPTLSDGYYDRSLIYSDVGRYSESLADLNFIAPAASAYPRYYYYRGYVHFENDQYEEAIADFDKALATMPRSPDVHYRRGKAFAAVNRREHAMRDFEATTRFAPPPEMLAAAYRWHGTEALALKRYEVAEKDLDVVLRNNPNDADAFMRRAVLYTLQGKFSKVIEDCSHVIHADVRAPVFPWPGIVDASRIYPDRIIDQYNAGVLAPGIDPYAYVLRARAYRNMGNAKKAASDYTAAIAVIPPGMDDSVATEMSRLAKPAP